MIPNITVDEVIRAGGCAPGIRRWFHSNADRLPEGFDMRAFLRQGFPVELAKQLDDPVLNRALTNREVAGE